MPREWGSANWERLLADRGDQLMGTAIALAGSRDAGQDLLQAALERVLRKPRHVDGDMEGYLRRVLYNLAADGWRRRGRWRQKLPLLRSEAMAAAADDTVMVDLRDVLVRLVRQLPPKQRAVIVLRYWEQRTEAETARLLGCSEGFSAAGGVVFTSGIGTVTTPSGKHVPEAYGAAYPARTRWRSPLTGSNGKLPELTCANAFPGAATAHLRATILKALSCKLFALGGHQQVDGVNAIKLIMRPPPGLRIRETLWLDPSTYLPLQTSAAFLSPHGQVSVLTQDFRWLPPTKANLAALQAAIHRDTTPPSFRALPPADLPLPGFDTSPGSQP